MSSPIVKTENQPNMNNDTKDFSRNDDRPEPEQYRKLFIGGLDFRTTDETLKKHFEQWGEIVDVVVMKDPKTRKSRGFGFITYSKAHMVDDAQNARPHVIDGREVEPKRAVPRDAIGKPETGSTVKKLFVGGLKDDITEADLTATFSRFGKISNVNIVTEKETGKMRGFAFLEFDDYDPVDKIVLLRHHMVKGRHVDVKKALSKAEMANKGPGGRGPPPMRGGDMGGGRGGRDRSASWGGRGGGGDSWGGGYGNNGGGGGGGGGGGHWESEGNWGGSGYRSGGGGGGGYNNGPWDNSNNAWGAGGGNQGGAWGGSQGGYGTGVGGGGGGGWANDSFGGGYNDSYGAGGGGGGGAGPMRNSYSSARPGPYSRGGYGGGSGGGGAYNRGGGGRY